MNAKIEVIGYPNGQVRPLSDSQTMSHLFTALREAGFKVQCSTTWFEAKDDKATFVFQVES